MNFRTLDLNLLRIFDQVMQERNLTRAASNLALTQPAVSNALARLRGAIGDELVVRSGYGIVPTPRALEIWPSIRQALSQLQDLLTPEQFDPSTASISFILTMADATASVLIVPLLDRISLDAPGISLRIQPLTTRDPRTLLQEQDIDLAVGYFPTALAAIGQSEMQQQPAPFRHERLYDGHYVCVMRRNHPLAAGDLTLDTFCAARHLLVSFSGRPYGFVDAALAQRHRSRRIMLTVNQFFTAGQVVANTDLLTVLPQHFLASTGFQDRLTFRPLPIDVDEAHVEMLWHRNREARPGHAWLREAVAGAARSAFAARINSQRDEPGSTTV